MKKIYLSVMALAIGAFASAQTNFSFENWTAGDANGWTVAPGIPAPSSSNIYSNFGTTNPTPLVEETTGASDGASYAHFTSFTLSGSINPNIPDGDYASQLAQEIQTTDRPSELTFDFMSNFGANDSAVIFVESSKWNGSSRDIIAQGIKTISSNEAAWVSDVVSLTYFDPSNPDTITVYISSSIGGIFNTLGGNPVASPVAGSELEVDNLAFTIPTTAPNVSNVVSSDISDNGDGTDLQVTFDVPADETDVANYYAVTFESGEESAIGLLADPLAFVQANGITITPNGNSQTTVFTSADEAYRLNTGGTALESDPITENVAYVVVIYVEGANGAVDVWSNSNEVTLTSGGTGSIADQWKDNFNVYPNPTTNNVTFDFAGTNEVEAVTIMNVNGAVVKNIAVNGQSQVNASISELASGVYIYQVISNEGKAVITNKIMKK